MKGGGKADPCCSGWNTLSLTDASCPPIFGQQECSLAGPGSITEASADAAQGASKDEGSGGRTARVRASESRAREGACFQARPTATTVVTGRVRGTSVGDADGSCPMEAQLACRRERIREIPCVRVHPSYFSYAVPKYVAFGVNVTVAGTITGRPLRGISCNTLRIMSSKGRLRSLALESLRYEWSLLQQGFRPDEVTLSGTLILILFHGRGAAVWTIRTR